MPFQLRARQGTAQTAGTATPTKEYRRMWLLCCVFILCVTLAMFGNVSVSLDLCHSQQSAQPAPGAPGSEPVEPWQQQGADLIAASQLQVESSRAHSLTDGPSNAGASSAPINKVAMCTSIKWEQPADLREWVQYYECASGVLQSVLCWRSLPIFSSAAVHSLVQAVCSRCFIRTVGVC